MSRPWIDTLPPDAANALKAAMFRQPFVKGQLIFAPKETPRGLRIVETGSAYMGLIGVNGSRLMLAIIRQGGVIGHAGVYDKKETIVFIEAREDLDTLFVPAHILNDLRSAYPVLDRAIVDLIIRDLRGLMSAMEEHVLLSLEERVRACLRRLARESNDARVRSSRVDLEITQDELAAMTAASRPSVNAVLRQLSREDAIELGYRRISCAASFVSNRSGT